MEQKGVLAVVSGFAGSGKGTLMKALLAKYPDQYALSVSATTRSPRKGEQDGREYFFVTREQFERLIAEDALVEHACYVGNYYGTPKRYVTEQLEAGKSVLLEIDVQGALKVKERYPEAVLVFVTPPDAAELERRLRGRGTETEEIIQKRLRRAGEEAAAMERYEYILVNDDVDACTEELHRLLEAQKRRAARQKGFISRMQEELNRYQGNG